MDLRGYQTDLIADVRDAWGQGALNVMAVLPTGGGKTVCFGTILREHNGASCAIAHRSELVGQMSTTLAKLQVRHRIIAPVGTIRDIVTRHMHETGRSWHDPMALAAVAGVDTLTKRDLGSWAEQVTLWVIDECFPAGTLVDGRPIQDLRVGDTVTAFDEKTGGFEKRRVVRVFRNAAPKYMVRLTVPGHHVLYCTPGHPFWTRRGWVEAARLQPNDEVLSTEDIGSQEGQLFKWVGLDSIEVYERGDFGGPEPSGDDGFVYNIEVEGLHTYVANGVVVHNCHHLLAANKWGKGVSLFPNARGLAVTATPVRADGRGLGRGSDGLIDYMVQGPTKRELIDAGYLTDYRIFAPASDIDLANVPVSDTTGDFSAPALRDAAKRSHVTGDIVENYMKIAPGKLGVTFCVSVELAGETAARYRAAGVPAEMVSANTPELERAAILRKFARRELLQLVNVDLFGEGFDLPAIEVVSMGRPTASYGLYVQQFGRACRPMENKDRAIIIDHVGNVLRHGLPDAPRIWTLDRRERRARNKEELLQQPVRVCPECTIVYEKFHLACPHCGHVPVPKSRAAPEHVDGDITELDPAVLARLRRESDVDAAPKVPYGANDAIRGAIMKRHRIWKESQRGLRETMALYGGWQKHLGRPQREAYKRFFVEFGVDVATAQGLPTSEATELNARIAAHLTANGVVQA